ncbi:calnexin-like [Aricia agestis]|uniref:calnexin-like n=1 Tax=Aricia agestis TaxID=91739 RepID=UPI001C2076E3|nr:calnexin-like [Aricia agestis]
MAHKYRILCLSALLVLVAASHVVADEDADGVVVETEDDETYESPTIDPKKVYLAEHFDDEAAFKKKWVVSEAKKQGVDEDIAKYDGKWEIQAPSRHILKNDLGLVLTTEAKHAAISALLNKPFEFKDKPLVVQYEVTMQEGQNCGGAYIKLLSRGTNTVGDLRRFHDQTPYTIMFGPDKCGNDNKLHFIFRHQNPKNGTIEEKHSKKPTQRLDDIYKDKEPHLYTLIVRPDNTFTVLVDNKEANAGSLLEDFTPPVNPPEEIDDPDDRKPEDWDEREKIVDPTAVKPEDWDETEPAQILDPNAMKPDGWLDNEPETIPDPEAKKPDDWDEEMDGSWEAPLIDNPRCAEAPGCGEWRPPAIPNPKYKGPWRAPLISNPNYRGRWAPRRIPNPHYFRDDHPFRMTPVHAVGFELWSMSPMLLFDNLIITDDVGVAEEWARTTYALKRAKITSDSESVVERALKWAGANPWVWAALIVVSFVIVGSVAYCCCGPKPQDIDADIKKTDAMTEADPHSDEDEPEDRPEEKPERPGKAGLEEPEPDTTDTTPPAETEGAGDAPRKRKPRNRLTMWTLLFFSCVLCLHIEARPNIILFIADDLGWNDVGFHGSNQVPTPNIDALAAAGLSLHNYYVTPICTPSRASLMTGKYAIHTGMQHTVIFGSEPRGLPLSEKLLPQYLKELGYSTHLVGKWHLGSYKREYLPMSRGFDSHLGFWTGKIDLYDHTNEEKGSWGTDFRRGYEVAYDLYGRYATDIYTDEAVKIINSHNRTSPLFLMVSHSAVHSGNPAEPLRAPDRVVDNLTHIQHYQRRKFAAMLTKMDESIGEVVRALQARGLLENSIVMFSTDNGGPADGFNDNAASNYPLRGVKNTLWEGGVRGAGLVFSPLLERPARVARQRVHIVDWLPTLLNAAGYDVSTIPGLDGLDQWAALSRDCESRRTTLVHNIDDEFASAAITVGKWKLHKGTNYNGNWDGWYGPSGREGAYDVASLATSPAGQAITQLGLLPDIQKILQLREEATVQCSGAVTPCRPLEAPCLFDIEADPCELNNLADSEPGILLGLLQELERVNRTAVPPNNKPLDPRGDPKHWGWTYTNFGDFDLDNFYSRYQF